MKAPPSWSGNVLHCAPNTALTLQRPLLIVQNRLRRRFAHFKLRAHFFDLSGLLFHSRSKRLNLLLLASNSRFLFLVLAVLLEKLVAL